MFLVTADGSSVENPRHQGKAARELKKAHKQVSRRQRGSKDCWKAVGQCAKTYPQVQRHRRDLQPKTALQLVRAYDGIYREDLPVRDLSRRPAPRTDSTGG